MPNLTITPQVVAASLLAGPTPGTLALSMWLDLEPTVLAELPFDLSLLVISHDAHTTTLAIASTVGLLFVDAPTPLVLAAANSVEGTVVVGLSASPPPASWWARLHAMDVMITGSSRELAAALRTARDEVDEA